MARTKIKKKTTKKVVTFKVDDKVKWFAYPRGVKIGKSGVIAAKVPAGTSRSSILSKVPKKFHPISRSKLSCDDVAGMDRYLVVQMSRSKGSKAKNFVYSPMAVKLQRKY